MRLSRLHLDRYGPFTDRILDFPANARLHVVHGPNEAGKSCALAAVTDLFFGIEARSRFDFVHAYDEMRLGAEIEGKDGARLVFRRRKGNKNTLLDVNDRPIGDDALAPFLGGLGREVFRNAFGLDAETLKAGAREMLDADGDLGAALFAASSGLRGLTRLKRTLEAEANDIFAPRKAKDRRFYQALDRFEDARRAIRDSELRSDDWKKLNHEIDELGEEVKTLENEIRTVRTESARLGRLRRAAPIMQAIDTADAELAALGALPDVPVDYADELAAALTACNAADIALREASAAEERAREAHAKITVDDALLADAGAISALHSELAAFTAASRELPQLERDAEVDAQALAALAARVGLADPSALERGRPSDATIARIRKLVADGDAHTGTVDETRRRLAEERETLARLVEPEAGATALADPAPLLERFAALDPVVRAVPDHRTRCDEIAADTQALAEAAARLVPTVDDLDRLAAAPLPSRETVAAFGIRFDALAADLRHRRQSAADIRAEREEIAAELQRLAAAGAIATREAIRAARAAREAVWHTLRARLTGASAEPAGDALLDAIAGYERAVLDADRLADSAAADADRVASHRLHSERLAAATARLAVVDGEIEGLEAEHTQLAGEWTAAWAGAGVAPLTPAEMTAWLVEVHGLLKRREALGGKRTTAERFAAELAETVPRLAALAAGIGIDPALHPRPDELGRHVGERLREMTTAWNERRDAATRRRDLEGRIDRLGAQEREALARIEDWRAVWCEAIPALGLPETATTAEATAALDAWDDVPGALRQRNERLARIDAARAAIRAFTERTGVLVAALAPDLAARAPAEAIGVLQQRASEAGEAAARRSAATQHLAAAVEAREEAQHAKEAADTTRERLAAHAPPAADLADFAARLARRAALIGERGRRLPELANATDGLSEDDARAGLAGFDPDAAAAHARELEQREAELDARRQEAHARRARLLDERETLTAGTGAEAAALAKRSAEAEIAEAARDYARRAVAALLLREATARRRAAHEAPLLARAGELFRTLTADSFATLVETFAEDDSVRLAGRRPDGATVPIEGMSEGTERQLYLALRLAYLEDYAARAEPAPFVADDLFAAFDEERTREGLAALAAIGDRVQPILFTHHRFLAEMAEATLGEAVSVSEL